MNFGIFLLFLNFIYAVTANFDDCYYQYKHECHEERRSNNSRSLCSLDNISEVNLELTNDGILTVNLSLPNSNCRYKVALLADSTIKNQDDCKNYIFIEDNNFEEKIHTSDRIICVSTSGDMHHYQSDNLCETGNLTLEYQYIFTGCYALRYTIDEKNYLVQSNKFFHTNYTLNNVIEPRIRCSFDNRENLKDSNHVTFNLGISMESVSPSMVLSMRSMSIDDENKIDACNKYSKKSPYDWEINLGKCGREVKNCNFMVIHNNSIVSNGIYTGDIECSFLLPVSFNDSYCFLLALNDERCIRHTVWDPPPKDSPPCVWMTHCNRIIKTKSQIFYPGLLQDERHVPTDSMLLIPIAVGVTLLVLVICGITYTIYRWRLVTEQEYLNANLRELKVTNNFDIDGIIDTDDECKRIVNSTLDNQQQKSILLLYARGSPSFMGLMTEFRDILKKYCGCHVYDWYAACEWNSVAKAGACDWAVNLIKKNHRTVWIDTPAARQLMNEKLNSQNELNEDAISDFRDMAFPAVLECAKRSCVNPKLQYSQHFVVRLEGVKGNSSKDPFSDLSPHARYLIPYHLSQLCSYLSSRKSDSRGNALMTVEVQLRERLIQIKNDL